MELPYASEIRALRASVERAGLARQHLAAVESALTALAMGSGAGVHPLVATLRTAWPDLGLHGDPLVALGAARLELGRVVALGDRASRELHPIQEQQWQALESEAWEGVRAEITSLLGRRAVAHASFSPVEGMIAGLVPLVGALDLNLPAIANDLSDPDATAQRRAALNLQTLVAALHGPLERLGMTEGLPAPAAAAADPRAALQELGAFRADLDHALTRLHRERVDLKRELDAVDASLRARTG